MGETDSLSEYPNTAQFPEKNNEKYNKNQGGAIQTKFWSGGAGSCETGSINSKLGKLFEFL